VGENSEVSLVVFVKKREDDNENNVANSTVKIIVNPIQAENAEAVIERVESLAEESILTGKWKSFEDFGIYQAA